MKKVILMMIFGLLEEIIFEGVVDFFINICCGVRF